MGHCAWVMATRTEPATPCHGALVFPARGCPKPRAGGNTHDFAKAALHLHVGLAVVVDVGFAVLAPQAKFVVDWRCVGEEGQKGEAM